MSRQIGNVNSVPNNCIRTATHKKGPNREIEISTYAYTHINNPVVAPNWKDHLNLSHKSNKRSIKINSHTEALIMFFRWIILGPGCNRRLDCYHRIRLSTEIARR
jgi:hypothetical protein